MQLFNPTLQLSSGSSFFSDFDFLGFEQPESIRLGKQQSSYKHILIGGGRVIDLLGAGDPDITWTGYFRGPGSIQRAQFLQQMAAAGTQITLTAGPFIKLVVITSFVFDYKQVFPMPYTITLQVIQDLTSPVPFLVPGDLTNTILEALIQAQDIAQLLANPSISSALALALIAAQVASPFDTASVADINAALSAAQVAQAAVSTAITAAESNL